MSLVTYGSSVAPDAWSLVTGTWLLSLVTESALTTCNLIWCLICSYLPAINNCSHSLCRWRFIRVNRALSWLVGKNRNGTRRVLRTDPLLLLFLLVYLRSNKELSFVACNREKKSLCVVFTRFIWSIEETVTAKESETGCRPIILKSVFVL